MVAFGAVAGQFNVKDFGVVADGWTKDTVAVQKAIDAAAAGGGGTVEVPEGKYRIGSVFLKSNVDLHLAKGAVLQASADRADYNRWDVCPQNSTSRVECASGAHLILCIEQTNVTVRGEGRIEGNSAAFLLGPDGKEWPFTKDPWTVGIPWRPSQMLYFVESSDIRIEGIEVADSPYWSVFLHGCENVTVERLNVHTIRRPFPTHNGDGIDIDACRHVRVRDCTVNSADDSITLRCNAARLKKRRACEDVEVTGCRLSSPCNAIRIGVGDGTVKNAVFRDIVVTDSRMAVNFVSAWRKGGRGVDFRDIRFDGMRVDAKAFCSMDRRCAENTVFKGIVFENVCGTVLMPSHVSGTRAHPLGSIVFRNVDLPCGIRALNAPEVVIDGGTLRRIEYSASEAAEANTLIEEKGRYPGHIPFRDTPPKTAVVKMLPGESWWGCANYFGSEMPFGAGSKVEIDLIRNGWYNQYASLLVSDKGRVIWCDEQCRFVIQGCTITVEPEGCAKVEVVSAGKTLREAFRFASEKHFPPSGRMPDPLFFSAPQYNTWIELTYNQNEKDILAYAQSMLNNGLPPGVFMIDDTWQTGYGVWEFDARRFHNPKGMVAKLHDMGFKVILWICPWVGMDTPAYRRLAHGRDPGTVERLPIGGLYTDVKGRPAPCDWWNGVSALVDFTHPQGRSWFKSTLDRLVRDYGVDGFKLDGGALSHYKKGFRPHEYMASGDQANGFAAFALQYPVCEYRHAWKFGGQPIVERLHDKRHTWKDLRTLVPAMIAGGLLGHPFMCPDMIGGGEWTTFLPGAPFDPELFVRSAQVHALCGQMQFSASPWRMLKDERHREIIRRTVATRQRFADRFVALAKTCGSSGEPMIRNLEYVFPGLGYADIKDQFMMGDFLLVAPVLEKGATSRRVVIPPGKWRADDGTEIEGPQTVEIAAPLERLPHFERM